MQWELILQRPKEDGGLVFMQSRNIRALCAVLSTVIWGNGILGCNHNTAVEAPAEPRGCWEIQSADMIGTFAQANKQLHKLQRFLCYPRLHAEEISKT